MSIAPEWLVFDAETKPRPDLVAKYTKPFSDFDESAVKCGNIKDPAKIKEKIDASRAQHEADRAAYWKKAYEDAALDPFTGEILCIGVASDVGAVEILAEKTEAATLRAFWQLWELRDCVVTKFVFWSGCGDVAKQFDIDYIVTRSRINRVPVPAGVRQGRYYSNRIMDLAKEFLLYQRERYCSLTKAAEMLGLYAEHPDIAPKTDSDPVQGVNFWQWWEGSAVQDHSAEEQRALACKYLVNDVSTLKYMAPIILP